MNNMAPYFLAALFLASAACGGGGGGGEASAPPQNEAPQASVTVTSSSGYAPYTVEFDGSNSSDRDGSIATYTWHTGDGSSYSGSKISHTYTTLGQFTATLTVTDDDGASSSKSVAIEVFAQVAGPYWGDACSSVTGQCIYVWGIIGSDHRVYFDGFDVAGNIWNRNFGGSASVDRDSVVVSMLAEIYEPSVFLDGTRIGNVVATGQVEPQFGIFGQYSGVGDVGSIDLNYNTPIDKPASLAKLQGVWSWSDGLGYTVTMVIEADGSFVETDTVGCVLVGKFSLMDARRNEYDIIYDLTCPPGVNAAGDGRRTGLALIDDYYEADEWLYWSITFQEGPLAGRTGGSSLARPRASGVSHDGVQKAESPKIRQRALR